MQKLQQGHALEESFLPARIERESNAGKRTIIYSF